MGASPRRERRGCTSKRPWALYGRRGPICGLAGHGLVEQRRPRASRDRRKTPTARAQIAVELPRLGPREVRYLDDNALPLAKGKESSARKEIGVFGMMRVKNYMEEIYPQLDQSVALSAFRPESNGKPSAQAEKPTENSARAVKSKR